ncbi:hypothetical protein [Gordonia amicalis]|uniref:hypothetical protein n=1 Tax=Gordonia amicalis TaxID=89053 RepID=UPI003A7F8E9E
MYGERVSSVVLLHKSVEFGAFGVCEDAADAVDVASDSSNVHSQSLGVCGVFGRELFLLLQHVDGVIDCVDCGLVFRPTERLNEIDDQLRCLFSGEIESGVHQSGARMDAEEHAALPAGART